jgi:membrane-associated phospholipid phosphatase
MAIEPSDVEVMGTDRRTRPSRRLGKLLAVLTCTLIAPGSDAAAAQPDSSVRVVAPELRWPRETLLAGSSIVMLGAASALDVNIRPVPPQGLDPAELAWSIDRDRVGKIHESALTASDVASAASFAYPLVLAFSMQPHGARFSGTLRRTAVYAEAYLLATGLSTLIKNSEDRPRPYTYVSENQRPDNASYDVTDREAFQSMPSSHASTAFCGAAFAITDHLLTRPRAPWLERCSVAFAGGLLAGLTTGYRVQAGKHFPSDVLAGGAIGLTSGVTLPLVHRYVTPAGQRAPGPSREAWLQAFGAMVVGVGSGVLIAEASN